MARKNPLNLLRPHILSIKPYSSARDDYQGEEGMFFDANENSMGSATPEFFNRYPDPHQRKIKEKLSKLKGVAAEQLFIGNGSDEPIDLLIRAFCEPGKDHIITLPPTYGMYQVSAAINNVEVKEVLLDDSFQPLPEEIKKISNAQSKILFICSPNNPTGNLIDKDLTMDILKHFPGIVILDEAYIDFAEDEGFLPLLKDYPNLVILQTLSKAWGLANLRLGMAMASREIIKVLNTIKPPYNISGVAQEHVLEGLSNTDIFERLVRQVKKEKIFMEAALKDFRIIKKIYPSDTNFLLVEVENASGLYQYLTDHKLIVRDRSSAPKCANCLRITIGSHRENVQLLNRIRTFSLRTTKLHEVEQSV